MTHSPEPWEVHDAITPQPTICHVREDGTCHQIADCGVMDGVYGTPMALADAERIVACVNACAGITTERVIEFWGWKQNRDALAPIDRQARKFEAPWRGPSMTEAEAAPTWHIAPTLFDAVGNPIGAVDFDARDRLIACVNCHDELVSLVKELRDAVEFAESDFGGPDKVDRATIDKADALLAKLEQAKCPATIALSE